MPQHYEYDEVPQRRTSAVDIAYEIVDMHREIQRLQAENFELREYRQKYMDLLDQSVAHGQRMIGGLLTVAIKMSDDAGRIGT